jgi:hypothetical protein
MKAIQVYYKLKQIYDQDQGKTLEGMDLNVIVSQSDEYKMYDVFDFKTDNKKVANIHAGNPYEVKDMTE